MKLIEAKERVMAMMRRDIATSGAPVPLDLRSPDGDPGKFLLNGRPTRIIARLSGWNVPINLRWFAGSDEPPEISGRPLVDRSWSALSLSGTTCGC